MSLGQYRENAPRILEDTTQIFWVTLRVDGIHVLESVPLLKRPEIAATALRNAMGLRGEEATRLVQVQGNKVRVLSGAFSEGNLRVLKSANLSDAFEPDDRALRIS
jgi:hypothetical protein